MPIVEFIGGMGCGKSTLFTAVERKLKQCAITNVVTRSEFYGTEIVDSLKQQQPKKYYLSVLPLFRPLRARFLKEEVQRLAAEHIATQEDAYAEIIRVVLFEREKYSGPLLDALKRTKWFTDTLYELASIRSMQHKYRLVVVDEGLLHRCTSMMFWLDDMEGFVARYCNALPYIPKLAIHVKTDRDTAITRLEGRKLHRSRHIATHDAAVSMSEYMASYVRESGGSVLSVNGADDPSANAEKCVEKIREVAEQLHREY